MPLLDGTCGAVPPTTSSSNRSQVVLSARVALTITVSTFTRVPFATAARKCTPRRICTLHCPPPAANAWPCPCPCPTAWPCRGACRGSWTSPSSARSAPASARCYAPAPAPQPALFGAAVPGHCPPDPQTRPLTTPAPALALALPRHPLRRLALPRQLYQPPVRQVPTTGTLHLQSRLPLPLPMHPRLPRRLPLRFPPQLYQPLARQICEHVPQQIVPCGAPPPTPWHVRCCYARPCPCPCACACFGNCMRPLSAKSANMSRSVSGMGRYDMPSSPHTRVLSYMGAGLRMAWGAEGQGRPGQHVGVSGVRISAARHLNSGAGLRMAWGRVSARARRGRTACWCVGAASSWARRGRGAPQRVRLRPHMPGVRANGLSAYPVVATQCPRRYSPDRPCPCRGLEDMSGQSRLALALASQSRLQRALHFLSYQGKALKARTVQHTSPQRSPPA